MSESNNYAAAKNFFDLYLKLLDINVNENIYSVYADVAEPADAYAMELGTLSHYLAGKAEDDAMTEIIASMLLTAIGGPLCK